MIKILIAKFLASKFLKGKLTNGAAIGSVILPVLQAFGVDVASTEVDAIVAGVLALIVIIGKARAVFQAK